jgi:DHA1 family tetracycline resistance protein-like MFS transporter
MSPVSWSFVSPDARRGRSLGVIYATVALDAAGIGLVFPILPRLIREVTHSPDVAPHVGWMAALYAVTPFVFAPVLGALSDRLGRRPVLLVSLVGAPINYGVMALAPQL